MVRGSLITFVFQVIGLVLGIIPKVLLAAMLHDRGLGMFEIFRFIPTFLHAISNLGLNSAIVNFIGRKRYTEAEMAGLSFTGGLFVSVLTLVVGGFVFTGIRYAFWGYDLIRIPNAAVILAILIYIPYMLWFCNLSVHLGRNRMLSYNIVWVLQPVVAFLGYVLIWFLVPPEADLRIKLAWVFLSYSAGILVSLAVGLAILARDGLVRLSYPKGALWQSAKFGIQIHIGSFVGFLGLRINVPFLTYLMDEAAVGIYSIPMVIGESFKRIFSSIAIALLPVASSAEEEKGRTLINVVLRITIFICVVTLGLFALVCRPVIIFLFKEEFAPSVEPARVILIWVLFSSLNKVFQSDAIGRGKPIWVTYTTVATFAVLFASAWVLVPSMGVMGAAWASSFSAVAGFVLWIGIYLAKADGFNLAHALIIKTKDIVRISRKLLGRTDELQMPE
jgi:O-antigen/teichoic acid export membrane protein